MRAGRCAVKPVETWRRPPECVSVPRMKWLFALLLLGALAYAAATVPPKTAARMAARGLRAGWDWVNSVGPAGEEPRPATGERQSSRKAQAAAPQRRATRDGIVPQAPKETLHPNDRAALDELLAKPARAGNAR